MDTQKVAGAVFLSSRSKKSLFVWILKSLPRACRGRRINDAKGSQNKSLLRFFLNREHQAPIGFAGIELCHLFVHR